MVLDAQHVGADTFSAVGETVAVALQSALDQHHLVIAVGAVDETRSGSWLVRSKRSGSAW